MIVDKTSLPHFEPERFTGADCSGTSGTANRVLTTSDISSALGEPQVIVEGRVLIKTTDYTTSGNSITFLKPLFNQHRIEIWYLV